MLKMINFFNDLTIIHRQPLKSSLGFPLSPSSFNVFTQCHVTVYALLFRSRLKWPVRYCLLSPDYGVFASLSYRPDTNDDPVSVLR